MISEGVEVKLSYIPRIILAVAMPLLFLWPVMIAKPAGAATTAPGTVRVALVRQVDAVTFKTSGDYQLIDRSTGKEFKLSRDENWRLELDNGRIGLQSLSRRLGPFIGPVSVAESSFGACIVTGSGEKYIKTSVEGLLAINEEGQAAPLNKPASPSVISAGGTVTTLASSGGLNLVTLNTGASTGRYRGNMEFQAENGKLTVINELNIEDYLCGVVPVEAYATWPAEALKAQAVAARNFAMRRVETTRGQSYSLTNDITTQVYGGYDVETPATNQAVKETSGLIMLCQGKLIDAFFHSSSGGCTENSEDVWSGALPYIKGKADPYGKNPSLDCWQKDYTVAELIEKLGKKGYRFKKITDIDELARTTSGQRVQRIAVKGLDLNGKPLRVEIFNADNVRIALGLNSALFTLKKVYDKDKNLAAVSINGLGLGHGLGMPQWGAYGMAVKGYNYQDILKYYYTGINFAGDYGRSPVSFR